MRQQLSLVALKRLLYWFSSTPEVSSVGADRFCQFTFPPCCFQSSDGVTRCASRHLLANYAHCIMMSHLPTRIKYLDILRNTSSLLIFCLYTT